MDNFDPAPFLPCPTSSSSETRGQWVSPASRLGFQLTLLFVSVTIVAAIIARLRFDAELVAIDQLHGGAEAFLTLSNALIVAGLLRVEVSQR